MSTFVKNPPRRIDKSPVFQLYAKDEVLIDSFQRVEIGLGYAITAPPGEFIQILPDPALALKGLMVLPNILFPGASMEVKLQIVNFTTGAPVIEVGEAVAQMIFTKLRPNIMLTPVSRKSLATADHTDKTKTKCVADPALWNQPRVKRPKTEETIPMEDLDNNGDPYDIPGDRFDIIDGPYSR